MNEQALEFDAIDHVYSVDGIIVPNVTSILAAQFPFKIPMGKLRFARERGKAIHKAAELDDQGILDIGDLDNQLVPYLEAWRLFKKQTGCRVIMIEQQVYHQQLNFAGTLDRVVLLYGSAVLDLKRPILNSRVGLQLAAYQEAFNSAQPTRHTKIHKRYGLQLRDDGTYRLREYEDRNDWTAFLACLNLYNWKFNHADI